MASKSTIGILLGAIISNSHGTRPAAVNQFHRYATLVTTSMTDGGTPDVDAESKHHTNGLL